MKIKRLSEFLNEDFKYSEDVIINIEKIDDERGLENKVPSYSVNYTKQFDGETIEIEGTLKSYNSGRSIEYKFEPDNFSDDNSESYYDENWEEIEEEILQEFNNK